MNEELLQPRQVEIMRHVAVGLTNGQIAYALGITEQTVKNHLTSICERLNAPSRTGAVYALGWIRLPGDPHPDLSPGDRRLLARYLDEADARLAKQRRRRSGRTGRERVRTERRIARGEREARMLRRLLGDEPIESEPESDDSELNELAALAQARIGKGERFAWSCYCQTCCALRRRVGAA